MDYSSLSSEEVYKKLETDPILGISAKEAKFRTSKYGKNEVKGKTTSAQDIFLRQIKSPFIYLLMGACMLSVVLGQYIDALMVFVFIAINTTLGFIQEYRSEQTVKMLDKHLANKARVYRDGKQSFINVVGLVPGDIVFLEPGDIIPADLRIVQSNNLSIDETMLTGESVPTIKSGGSVESTDKSIYNATNICFSGTHVVGGEAKAVVILTGLDTTHGDIVRLSSETKKASSYEKEISKFSKFILKLVAITLASVVVLSIVSKDGVNIAELIIFSIALTVSVIPEALPVVTTFSMSKGASRLAKKKVVVKRLSAIEDLGGVEILCSDKTGTLTQNKLKVEDILSTGTKDTLLYATCASSITTISRNVGNVAFENALYESLTPDQKKNLDRYKIIEENPFDPQRRRSSSIVEIDDLYEVVVRGAPEEIFPLLRSKYKLDKKLTRWIKTKGTNGIRVLAVASKKINYKTSKSNKNDETDLELIGLIAFSDPIKLTAKEAIAKARSLGVQVKILTGDSREVAAAVAREIGLISDIKKVITGEEFEKLDLSKQHKVVLEYHVFARVTPSQKYTIINILKEHAEVGFLGEGINDAPALKSANVGLVVKDASDVAREASDIVLLDKSLDVIVQGIREGREIFANTNKYITVTLSANFGNFFAIAVVSLFIDFLPMLPLQILLLNLLSDFPMISIATDTVDSDSVQKPQKYTIRTFATVAIVLGIVSTVYDFIFFEVFKGQGAPTLQTCWFIGSVLTELVLIYSIRTKKLFLHSRLPSRTMIVLTVVTIAITLLIPLTALGQDMFSFIKPSLSQITSIFVIVILYFTTTEIVKLIHYKLNNSRIELNNN